jgi:ketol-acid reductoisomerase
MKLFTTDDVKRDAISGQTIAVLGYGSQGRAHANNLKESGYRVIIGARAGGPTAIAAANAGFEVADFADAAEQAQLVCMLVPDMAQPSVYEQIKGHLQAGDTLLFAHGFNVHFGVITPSPDIDVIMVAPKSPGDLVRRQYQAGRGVPCLRAVYRLSLKKQKLTCSVNRLCFAAVPVNWCYMVTRPWLKPAISLKQPISNVSMN